MDANLIKKIFKKGDVVFVELKNSHSLHSTIAVYKEISEKNYFIIYYNTIIGINGVFKNDFLCKVDDIKTIRLASNSEINFFIKQLKNATCDFSNEIDFLYRKIKFTKDDLKSGMVVKLRNGQYYAVIGEIISNYNGFMSLSKYNNDLLIEHEDICDFSNQFDIVEIYYDDMPYNRHNLIQNIFNKTFYNCANDTKLIWKR